MAIVCPITNTDKNHPFHVRLNQNTSVKGVVLCDQPRTLDIYARNYELIERLPSSILFEVIDIISGFIELE
jgi:mRNA interferase MazF